MKILLAVLGAVAACVITAVVVNAMNASDREDAKRWRQHCAEVDAAMRVQERTPDNLKHHFRDSPLQDFAAQCKK
ncbi:MAG: hypothetical protein AB7T06_34775 [Kofleriaceae bacterium]